jgi:hypothetical protein
MNRTRLLAGLIGMVRVHSQALAQSSDVPKIEIAAEFTTLEREEFSSHRTEPGVGGRFTYNLNRVFSLEAAGYFFPKTCFTCRDNGNIIEVLGGIKAGKRFEKWGIFAKGRPGVVSFSRGEFNVVPASGPPEFPFRFELNRVTSFAFDAGGVVEFYPSKRIVTRFDVGDTIVHFNSRTFNVLLSDSGTTTFSLLRTTAPARTTHNFQFMASVGFRF